MIDWVPSLKMPRRRPCQTANLARMDTLVFGGLGLGLALVVFLGFAETFYLRGENKGPIADLFLVHGLIYTAWFLLFPLQAVLMGAGRVRLHRVLGWSAVALSAGMVITGFQAGFDALARGVEIPGAGAEAFFFLSFSDALGFAVLFAAALAARARADWHKRFMALASISVILPAAVRMAEGFGLAEAGVAVQLGAFGVLGLYDLWLWRWAHPATIIGGALLAVKLLGVLTIARTDAWAKIVTALSGL